MSTLSSVVYLSRLHNVLNAITFDRVSNQNVFLVVLCHDHNCILRSFQYTSNIKCTLFILLVILFLLNIYSSNLPSSGSLVECHVIFTLAFFFIQKIYKVEHCSSQANIIRQFNSIISTYKNWANGNTNALTNIKCYFSFVVFTHLTRVVLTPNILSFDYVILIHSCIII